MPLGLRDLQRAFADHLVGAPQAALVAEIVGDTIPAASRLNVYRHHVRHSLFGALAAFAEAQPSHIANPAIAM